MREGAAVAPTNAEVEVYKALRGHEIMLNQATAAFEHAAIAPLLLINGGGAVAFLTLMGAVADKKSKSGGVSIDTSWAVVATAAWAIGLVSAACAASLGYRAQRGFSKAHRLRRDAAEQRLLGASRLADVVRPDDYDETTWKADIRSETDKAVEARGWYSRARWTSIAAFVVGVACAAASVL
jgi:hypothetical protein